MRCSCRRASCGARARPRALNNPSRCTSRRSRSTPTTRRRGTRLAAVYVNQAGLGLRPLEEGVRLAREAATKALAIDPDYAPAHGRLGWIAMTFDGDLAAAARHYEHALALEPANTDIIGDAASLAASSRPPGHGHRARRIRDRPRPAQRRRLMQPGPCLPRRRAPGRGHRAVTARRCAWPRGMPARITASAWRCC